MAMPKYVKLPDNSLFPVEEGEDYATAMRAAYAKYPDAFGGEPIAKKGPESGFMPALKAGYQNLRGDISALAGKTGITDLDVAEQEVAARRQKAAEIYKPTEESWSQAPLTKIGELAGGSLPYMAAPLAAGAAALALPETAAAAAIGTGLAGLTSAAQFTGSNLGRQMEEGKTLRETELGSAALAAVPQAALDMVGLKMIPGVRQLFAAAGKEVSEQAAKKIAEQGMKEVLKDYGAATIKTMGTEGLTEAGQQVFERLQAGLSITDEKARSEYLDNFIGGAVLGGTLAPAGRYVERSGEAGKQAMETAKERRLQSAAEKAQADAAQKEQQAQEEAAKATPEYAMQVGQQYDTLLDQFKTQKSALKKPGADATPVEKAEYKDAQAQVAALNAQLKEIVPEYRRTKTLREQELEKKRVSGMSPEDYMLEQTQEVANTKAKQVAPDLGGYYEQQIAGPSKEVDPLQQYVDQRLGLMQQQSPTTDREAYVDYLMHDPVMARQVVQNRVPLPGLTRNDREVVLDTMGKHFAEFDKQQAEQADQRANLLSNQLKLQDNADLLGAARDRGPGAVPEIVALQNIGEKNRAAPTSGNAKSYLTEQFPQGKLISERMKYAQETLPEGETGPSEQDQALAQKVVDTLPKGAIITPGKVYEGLGGGTMRDRSDLLTQLAMARETKNNAAARTIIENLRGLNDRPTTGTGEIATAESQASIGRSTLPEARAKEAEADKFGEQQNKQLLELTRILGYASKGKLILPETLKQRTDATKQLYFEHHADEIDARRAAFGVGPMADWERGEARARVMEALNELQNRAGRPAKDAPVGQRQFGALIPAIAVLQDQMRKNIAQTVGNSVERANLNAVNETVEKTGATPTQYYTEDAAGNKKPVEIQQDQTQRRIAAPAELTLRAERNPAKTEETLTKLIDTSAQRQRAVPAGTEKPAARVSSFADIGKLLEDERSKGELEPMSPGSIELLHKIRETLPVVKDEGFQTLASKVVHQIDTGNEPNIFDVRDLHEAMAAHEEAAQSATRSGATQEELQRTSAQPQRELFPEASVQTLRETPRNFQKLLDSKNIQGLRDALAQQKTDNQAALAEARKNIPAIKTALDAAQEAYDASLAKIQSTTPNKLAIVKGREEEMGAAEQLLSGLRFKKRTVEEKLAEITRLRSAIYAAGESDGSFGEKANILAANAFSEEAALRKTLTEVDLMLANAGSLQKAVAEFQAAEKPVTEQIETASTEAEKEFQQNKAALAKEKQAASASAPKSAPVTETLGTPEGEYRAALQRAREGLGLPGQKRSVDTSAMKTQMANMRRALGSFDAQLEDKKLTAEKRAEIQKKRDDTAAKLEAVYQNAPRITSEIKEQGQLELEKAFDEVQVAGYEAVAARRRGRAGEAAPKLPTAKKGPVVKPTLGGQPSQSGEKKATPATIAAGDTLEKLAEERAALRELEAREKYLRDNNKHKAAGKLTPTFKALQEQIEKQKNRVAKVDKAQGKIAAEVRDTNKALGRKPVVNVASETEVGLKGEEETITKAPKVLYRTVTTSGPTMEVQKIENLAERITAGWANAPIIKVVPNEVGLPIRIRNDLAKDEKTGQVPGLYDTKTKTVYLIADALHNANDVVLTVAHEAAGHHGIRELLGATYTQKMDEIFAGNKAVQTQAKAKMKAEPNLSQQVAVEEVLAEMAEKPNPTPEEKNALQRIYAALKQWFAKTFNLTNVTDAEVQQLVADARQYVIEGAKKAEGQAPTSGVVKRTKAAKYEEENALTDLAAKIIAKPKTFKERMGTNLALEAEMNAVDMRAGLREALKVGAKAYGDQKDFVQAMYNVTKADQKMSVVQAVLSNGPLETYVDDKGYHGIRSTNKNSASEIFKAISDIPGGNEEGKVALATTYMIAQRAANKGLKKLDLGALGVTQAELDAAMAAAQANPAMGKALEHVRTVYNAYNKGMIEFLSSTGAIPKATAQDLLKNGDYVPFYRVNENGMADLTFGGEVTINIGDIRHQPYLNELKGGEARILPLTESVMRNTLLLTDKALTNLATKNVAYAMQNFGAGHGPLDKEGKPTNAMAIHKGKAPTGNDIVKFNQEPDPKDAKDTGERWVRVRTEGTPMEGIPSELVVKSLEGAHMTLPAFLKIGGIAGDILRSGVTRTPIYLARQLVRDPMAASFTGGLNYGPLRAVAKAGKEFIKMTRGTSDAGAKLIEKGLIQSGIFTGDADDMSKIALQLASGKNQSVIDSVLAAADRAAMRADAATRALVYENAINNGLSEVEADMMTMESMNFHKRGLSPSVQYASRLIPFFNAQIQGLNVLYKAATGQMPFEEQQQIKQKFFNNAMLLVGTGIVYAMAMEDDEYFKNAKPRDKYSNFFIPIPGMDEPFKLPIPYEAGWFFSLAVAAVDAMKEETDGKQQFEALRDMFLQSVPGYSSKGVPQVVKPIFEVFTNKNFFTGGDLESPRLQRLSPQERFNTSTTEAAKALSRALPLLSPIQIEHLATGYFGQLPLVVMGAASSLFKPEATGEAPSSRITDIPLIGSSFQKKYGGAESDVMYREAANSIEAKATYDSMRKQGRAEEAKSYLDDNRTEIAAAGLARNYQTTMGRLRADQDRITALPNMSGEEKRARIDKLDAARQDVTNKYTAALKRVQMSVDKTTRQ
jgi:hypothetical protein